MFNRKQPVNLIDQYNKKQVNLLPDLYFKKKKRVKYVLLAGVIAAMLVSGFVYQVIQIKSQLADMQLENQKLEVSIQEKKEESQRQLLLTALKNRIEYKVDLLKQIEAENASVIQISDAIESALPSGVLYVNASFNSEEAMTIYGKTETEGEIPDLVHKLRSMNLFKNIEVSSIIRTETENYAGTDIFFEFTLICSFGGDNNAAN